MIEGGIMLAGDFVFSSRRRHTRCSRDWSSDVCSSDLLVAVPVLICTGALQVTPQSVERLNIKCVGVELAFVAARKSVYAMYTLPAAKDCWTARFPPFAPAPGSLAVNEQADAPERGMSTASEGLSRNCELFPVATRWESL